MDTLRTLQQIHGTAARRTIDPAAIQTMTEEISHRRSPRRNLKLHRPLSPEDQSTENKRKREIAAKVTTTKIVPTQVRIQHQIERIPEQIPPSNRQKVP